MSQTQKSEKTTGEKVKPVAVTDGITPLKVVQKFIDAMKADSNRQELAENYVVRFLNRTFVAEMSGKNVPERYKHEGFEKAAFLKPSQAQILKSHLTCEWRRKQRMEEQRMRLHLRAVEEGPLRPRPRPMMQPSRTAKLDLDQLTFVESSGVLKRMCRTHDCLHFGDPIRVKIMLGYRHLPLAFDNGLGFEIGLAVYEKIWPCIQSVNSCLVPRWGHISLHLIDSSDSDDAVDSCDSDGMPPLASRKRSTLHPELGAKRQPRRMIPNLDN